MRTDKTLEEIRPERLPDEGREMIQNYITVLDDHATEHIGEPCYVVVANPNRCTLCYSRAPVNPALWIPTKEESLLFRYSNGWLFGGYVCFVCFECHAELGKDTILMAAESLKAQLQDALGESRYFGLEEWIA